MAALGTIQEALLAAARAMVEEGQHQSRCRAWAVGIECQACMDYERAWLDADRALQMAVLAGRRRNSVQWTETT